MFAVFVVTTAEDVVDESDGLLSLREAIIEANKNAESVDVITFSPDIRGQLIELTKPLVANEEAETGDLNITNGEISVVGFDTESTKIDLSKLGHRAFHVGSNAVLNLSNMTIRGGTADRGGAILVEGLNSKLSLTNVSIRDNNADLDGGGIYVDVGASLTFTDGNIVNNKAGRGGGIALFGGASVSRLAIGGNEATDLGGGIFVSGTTARVELHSLSMIDNEAGGGSAIANEGGTAYIANVTFSGNNSQWGGTVLNAAAGTEEAYLRILQSTIVRDFSQDVGSIHTTVRDEGNARTEIGNTIVNDTSGVSSLTTFIASLGSTVNVISLGHNLFFDDGGGHEVDSDLLNVDTLTTPIMSTSLAPRGGSIFVHEMLAGNPAIDAGDPSLAIKADGSPLLYDVRGVGFTRAFGATVDIGAFEYQVFSDADMVVTSLSDVIDPDDGVITLREALERANAQADNNIVQFASDLFASGPGKIALTNGTLHIRVGVTIIGPGASSLVIDGLGNARVFALSFENFDATLKGFTITGGATFADDPESKGGNVPFNFANSGPAVRSFGAGNLRLDSMLIENNVSYGDYAHGAVSVLRGTLEIVDSNFRFNKTFGKGSRGAAVHQQSGATMIRRSAFSENSTSGYNADGGAFATRGIAITIDSSTFIDNRTSGDYSRGGAVSVLFGSASIISSSFQRNSTGGIWSEGGAIYTGSNLDVLDSVITENRTRGYKSNGGGTASSRAINVTRSTIAGNVTESLEAEGGGIAFVGNPDAVQLRIESSDITRNISERGAELWFDSYDKRDLVLSTTLVGTQTLKFADSRSWRLGQPIVLSGILMLTASHVNSALSRITIETSHLYTNPLSPSDINNDGSVTALDALVVINEIARRNRSAGQSYLLGSPSLDSWRGLYFDQNQDGSVTPLDALRVINELSRASRAALGEASSAAKLADRTTPLHADAENEREYFEQSVSFTNPPAYQDTRITDLVLETFGLPPSDDRDLELSLLSAQDASSSALGLIV